MKVEVNVTTIKTIKIDSFRGTGDDGREYTIYIYQQQIITDTLDKGRVIEKGIKLYQLNNGNNLSRLSDGTYQIVSTGVIVTPI